jgi:hypothetical protein
MGHQVLSYRGPSKGVQSAGFRVVMFQKRLDFFVLGRVVLQETCKGMDSSHYVVNYNSPTLNDNVVLITTLLIPLIRTCL